VDDTSRKYTIQNDAIFLEPAELEGYYGLAIKIDRILLDKQTSFQHLVIAEAGPLGRVMLLDGNIQVSQFDESGYHEMLAHLPLLSHPDPRRVLVVGGGDGGTLREVLRHPEVERVDLCEIDGEVIEASRQFLPGLAGGFDDPRAQVHIADGIRCMKEHPVGWDVILVDSSDPAGPAEGLFQRPFYEDLRSALRPDGIAVTQSESAFLFGDLVKDIFEMLVELFPVTGYYQTIVPTYASGIIGFAFCSLGPNPLDREPDPRRLRSLGPMDYYSPQLHRASFALPRRFLRLLPGEIDKTKASVLNWHLEE
jgi:spermidine synthase